MQQLLLLPGMDGTGELFADFIAALPTEIASTVVQYPADVPLSYSEMADLIRIAAPTDRPYVLVAESFSTPLAIGFAAANPLNLKGLVLCAGFAASPVRGLTRIMSLHLAPYLSRFALPGFAIRAFLVGRDASETLALAVRTAVLSVKPGVMAARIQLVLSWDVRMELGDVAVPILCIQAKQDRLVPEECLKEILRFKPQAKLEAIDGPHLILQREPERTAEVISDFVRHIEGI